MANETIEEHQQQQISKTSSSGNNNNNNNDDKHNEEGFRKNGLHHEKILVERLSDMSIEDLGNPVITLSSVEDEDLNMEHESEGSRRRKNFASKKPLKASLSLDVPTLDIEEEAKRPPL